MLILRKKKSADYCRLPYKALHTKTVQLFSSKMKYLAKGLSFKLLIFVRSTAFSAKTVVVTSVARVPVRVHAPVRDRIAL